MESLRKSFVEVAPRRPWDQGEPVINGPAVFGLSPDKICFFVFPVRGERPLKFRIEGALPPGISLGEENGFLTGKTASEGDFPFTVIVSNAKGEARKEFSLQVHPNRIGLSPLLGWTHWNAWRTDFDQEVALRTAELLVSLGLAARGYSYLNIDSSWQGCTRDRKTKALNPNHRFPDMGGMVRKIHALGLHAGIYSTPMVVAWASNAYEIFRGSRGYPCLPEKGMLVPYANYFGGVGQTPFEKEDAACWAEWGFDYLKYDWPQCDPEHTALMSGALRATDRDFIFSLTTSCPVKWAEEYKKYANMFRDQPDSRPTWESICASIRSADAWLPYTGPGAWFDLDMLSIGPLHPEQGENHLTRDETLFAFSAWSILSSPVQLSCRLEELDEFTLDVISNEEILRVNQDVAGHAVLLKTEEERDAGGQMLREIRIYRKELSDGSAAYGFFNFQDKACSLEFDLPALAQIRDLWACRDLGKTERLRMRLPGHGVRVFRIKE